MNYLKKIWLKLVELFKQGLSPKQLAISLVVSTLVSIFPIIGVSTIALTCIAIPFKLNLPIMISFSYILSPLQILLFIPFINLGGYVFNTEHTLLSFEAIKASYDTSFFETIKALSFELLCGFVGWAITTLPIGVGLYFILKTILTYLNKTKTNQQPTT